METGGCDVSGVLLPNQESSFKVSGRKLSSRRLDWGGILEGCLLDQNPSKIYEMTLKQDSKCTCNVTEAHSELGYLDSSRMVIRFTTGVIFWLLQRKFRLGYPRAARMIEIFEQEGVVGPANGSKPRTVLINDYNKEA